VFVFKAGASGLSCSLFPAAPAVLRCAQRGSVLQQVLRRSGVRPSPSWIAFLAGASARADGAELGLSASPLPLWLTRLPRLRTESSPAGLPVPRGLPFGSSGNCVLRTVPRDSGSWFRGQRRVRCMNTNRGEPGRGRQAERAELETRASGTSSCAVARVPHGGTIDLCPCSSFLSSARTFPSSQSRSARSPVSPLGAPSPSLAWDVLANEAHAPCLAAAPIGRPCVAARHGRKMPSAIRRSQGEATDHGHAWRYEGAVWLPWVPVGNLLAPGATASTQLPKDPRFAGRCA